MRSHVNNFARSFPWPSLRNGLRRGHILSLGIVLALGLLQSFSIGQESPISPIPVRRTTQIIGSTTGLPDQPIGPFVNPSSGLPNSERLAIPAAFQNSQKEWTLPELIDQALQRNPSTRQQWDLAQAAAAQIGVANSAYYPTITAGADANANHASSQFGGTQAANQLGITPFIQLQYLILDFGARRAGVAQARFSLISQGFTYNQSLQTVVLNTMTSYYNVNGAKAGLANAEAALALAEATLQSVDIRFKAGLSTATDTAQARQNLEQSRFDLENSRGLLKNTEIQLANNIGVPANTKINVAEPSRTPSLKELDKEVIELVDLAFRQRPDLASQYNQWRSNLAAVDQAEANRWPTLVTNASAQRTYYNETYNGNDHLDNTGITVSFSWDVFDGGLKASQVDAAKAQANAAQSALMLAQLGAVADVVTSYVNFKTAAKKVEAAEALVEASQQSFDSTQISYKNGLKSILDVLTAQSDLTSARSSLIRSRTELFVASSNLSNATGSLVPRPARIQSPSPKPATVTQQQPAPKPKPKVKGRP